jgi:hypothetical protein
MFSEKVSEVCLFNYYHWLSRISQLNTHIHNSHSQSLTILSFTMSRINKRIIDVTIFGIIIVLSIVSLELMGWITSPPGTIRDWTFGVSVTSISVSELQSTFKVLWLLSTFSSVIV